MRRLLARTAWIVVALALTAACRGASPTPPPPSPLPPTATPTPVAYTLTPAQEQGRRIYLAKDCVNCHGSNLEFLVVVNLPQISEEAVRRQVRQPTGMMRGFPPEELSEDELEAIARYVVAVLSQRKAAPRP